MIKVPKLKPQGKDESDNDFSNRKAVHDKLRREAAKSREDADRFALESQQQTPPHIAALRRVFGKE